MLEQISYLSNAAATPTINASTKPAGQDPAGVALGDASCERDQSFEVGKGLAQRICLELSFQRQALLGLKRRRSSVCFVSFRLMV